MFDGGTTLAPAGQHQGGLDEHLASVVEREASSFSGNAGRLGITDAQFNALAADLKQALDKNGAKAADRDAVLDAVGGMRKDIVEESKEPVKKESKPGEEKKPTKKEEIKKADPKKDKE